MSSGVFHGVLSVKSTALSAALSGNPEVQAIRNEARALSAVLQCLDGALSDRARALTESVLANYKVTDTETQLTLMAMCRLVGAHYVAEPRSGGDASADQIIFEVTASAWMAWAFKAERRQDALKDLRDIPVPGELAEEGGAIHLMALHPWVLAVTALLEDNHEEARRQYRRATEMGAQLGTETNPAIQWTYAATFIEGG